MKSFKQFILENSKEELITYFNQLSKNKNDEFGQHVSVLSTKDYIDEIFEILKMGYSIKDLPYNIVDIINKDSDNLYDFVKKYVNYPTSGCFNRMKELYDAKFNIQLPTNSFFNKLESLYYKIQKLREEQFQIKTNEEFKKLNNEIYKINEEIRTIWKTNN